MKIQYCSDLHLEFEQNNIYLKKHPLKVNGDILILAGDIVPLHEEFFSNDFFSFASDHYRSVYWVPGNHEYYYNDISAYKKSFHIKLKSNIHIVNNIQLNIDNVNFIFSTLWSKISDPNMKTIEQGVSDFECISKKNRKLRAGDFNALHFESMNFIEKALNTKHHKTVMVTHHLPSCKCNLPEYNFSPINEAFCIDLTNFIETCDANFWIYGHSHFNQKPLYIGNTILLTNQLGYVHCQEQNSFKNNAYFSI